MKFASIDIGSNAVRLLFKNVFIKDDKPVFFKDSIVRVPVRLGEEAFLDGKLSEKKIKDLIDTMKAFKLLIGVHKAIDFKACATSAMREAENGAEVAGMIKEQAGIDVEVISGKTEARMILNSEFGKNVLDEHHYLYIDVGGGSTKLVFLHKGESLSSQSFRIGTLRLLNDMVDTRRWKSLRNWLEKHRPAENGITAIGSGGNINKLVKLYGDQSSSTLDLETIGNAHEYLSDLTIAERVKDLGLKPDRADVIVPASEIFQNVMNWANIKTVVVPKFGISDGIIRELFEAHWAKVQSNGGADKKRKLAR